MFLVSTGTGAYAILCGRYGRWIGRSGWVGVVGPQATWAGCMAIAAGAMLLAPPMRTRRAAILWVAFCVSLVIAFGVVLVRTS